MIITISFQNVDVVVTFPADSSESTVLWIKSQIEKIPGILLRTKLITITKGTKTRPNCFSFQLTASYHGYLQGLELMQIPKPIKDELGGGMKEFTIREVHTTKIILKISQILLSIDYTFFVKSQHSLKFVWPLYFGFRPFK